MSFSLISNAYAEGAAPAAADSGAMSLLFPFLLIVAFYFLILRPQHKRSKEQMAMLAALQKGDEVVTSSGIVGRVAKLGDNYISVEVASNTVIQLQRSAIQSVLPKGTLDKSN